MKNTGIIRLPLGAGKGKNPLTGQFKEYLPVNVLALPAGVVAEGPALRSFPGVERIAVVDGISRGALLNPADAVVYRVCGTTLYKDNKPFAELPGSGSVPMAGGTKSIAVATQGQVMIFSDDGEGQALRNWPFTQYYPGKNVLLSSGNKSTGYDGTLEITDSMTLEGKLVLTLTPAVAGGATGETLTLDAFQTYFDQDKPATGTPYLTDAIIEGFAISGTTATVRYTLNLNGAEGDDATVFAWKQVVMPTSIANAQYDLGYATDVVRAGARYAWVKRGTNTFGVTDMADETRPDRYRPFITAESFPDPAVGIGELNGDIALFGTVSTEFFSLTGSTSASVPVYRSQSAATVSVGIAGPCCKALVGDMFAVISNPAGGMVSVYLVGSGRAREIASPAVLEALAATSHDDLAQGSVEYLAMGTHRLVFFRFGEYTFCYDMSSGAWCQLCSDDTGQPYRYTGFISRGGGITAGSTREGTIVRINASLASQEERSQPHMFYTTTLQLMKNRLFDLELLVASGTAGNPENIYAAASTDGVAFPAESPMPFNAPQNYFIRPHLARVGYVIREILFRFRIVSAAPFSVSGCQVRIA